MLVIKLMLWVMGIVAVCVAICYGIIFLERKFPGQMYDERQKIARGKAHQTGFVVGFIYFIVVMEVCIWQVEKDTVWVEPYILVFWGLLLEALVLNIYCLLTGSALPWDEKGDATILTYFGIAFLNLIGWIGHIPTEPIPFVGKASSDWIGLSFGLCGMVLGILNVIHRVVKEKE